MSSTPEYVRYVRSRELHSAENSRLVLIDVQEKFLPVIPVAESLIENCSKLLRGAGVLHVPISATEQYPRGLGHTVAQLAEFVPAPVEKLRFSSAECLNLVDGGADERYRIVLCGIETHVCVQQTALDLLAAGYEVTVPADAVASQRQHDWKFALDRMRDAGVTITTAESVLFEWCEIAGTEEFKQISRIVTGR